MLSHLQIDELQFKSFELLFNRSFLFLRLDIDSVTE